MGNKADSQHFQWRAQSSFVVIFFSLLFASAFFRHKKALAAHVRCFHSSFFCVLYCCCCSKNVWHVRVINDVAIRSFWRWGDALQSKRLLLNIYSEGRQAGSKYPATIKHFVSQFIHSFIYLFIYLYIYIALYAHLCIWNSSLMIGNSIAPLVVLYSDSIIARRGKFNDLHILLLLLLLCAGEQPRDTIRTIRAPWILILVRHTHNISPRHHLRPGRFDIKTLLYVFHLIRI